MTGELLVCLTVLVPIILVLIGVFPFAYAMDHKAADFIEAQEVARDQLETLRARPFDEVSSFSTPIRRGKLDLTATATVDDWPSGQNPVRQKRVQLQVSWRGEHYRVTAYLYRWAP